MRASLPAAHGCVTGLTCDSCCQPCTHNGGAYASARPSQAAILSLCGRNHAMQMAGTLHFQIVRETGKGLATSVRLQTAHALRNPAYQTLSSAWQAKPCEYPMPCQASSRVVSAGQAPATGSTKPGAPGRGQQQSALGEVHLDRRCRHSLGADLPLHERPPEQAGLCLLDEGRLAPPRWPPLSEGGSFHLSRGILVLVCELLACHCSAQLKRH